MTIDTTIAITADPKIAQEYAFFQADPLTQAQQNSYDLSRSIDNAPAKDFAWAKAMERARNRARPTWDQDKARFMASLEAKKYAQAIA